MSRINQVVREAIRAWVATSTITISINSKILINILKLMLKLKLLVAAANSNTAKVSLIHSSYNMLSGIIMLRGHEVELTRTILSYLVTTEDPTKIFFELKNSKI